MRNHRIRLIASDLDGTLLRDDKTVSARTSTAIAAAREAGIFVLAATGRQVTQVPAEVEAAGGMAQAISEGIPKLRIEEAAARTQARIDSGRQPVIGVNKYQVTEDHEIEVLKVENSRVRAEQLAKLEQLRADRDEEATRAALDALTRAAGA